MLSAIVDVQDMWITMSGAHSATVEIKSPDDQSNIIFYSVNPVGSSNDCIIRVSPYICNFPTGQAQTRYTYLSWGYLTSGSQHSSISRSAWAPPYRKLYAIIHYAFLPLVDGKYISNVDPLFTLTRGAAHPRDVMRFKLRN